MAQLDSLHSIIESLAQHDERLALLALRKEAARRWSYGELADQVQRLATGLVNEGLGRDDFVAVLAGNRPEWIVAALAVIRAGAVLVPVDAQAGEEALRHILEDSGARLIFTTADRVEQLEQLDLNSSPAPVLLDAGAKDEPSERSWRRLLAERAAALPQLEPEAMAVLFYTSGTTGPPKGVPLSHKNMIYQINTIIDVELVTGQDRLLLPLPLHHVYPFAFGMLAPLALGLPIILPQSLTGPQITRALGEGDVTMIIGVPRLYRALYDGLTARVESGSWLAATLFKAAFGLSLTLRRRLGWRVGRTLLASLHERFGPKVRILASGGSKLDPDLAWQLEGLGWRIATGYGLTETAPLLTMNLPGQIRIGSAGRPLEGVELRLDPSAKPNGETDSAIDGLTTEAGQEGEILARGPNVFAGYRNLPEQTEEVLSDDGWFRTGDLGYFDADGYLYVTGRVSTMIITESGEKVQPDEVEGVYLENPFIREVGVMQQDNQLVALIVPELSELHQYENGNIDQAIREAVEQQSKKLPTYQRISDYVTTREPLPRTRLGKPRRHLLPELYQRARKAQEQPDEAAAGPIPVEEMSDQDRALLEDPVARQVWEWLAERYPDQRLTPDTSPQLDLGVDSLAWVNLTLDIGQRTGVELTEEAIGRIDTVRDLLQEVAEASETQEAPGSEHLLGQPDEFLSEQQKRWLEPLSPGARFSARLMFGFNRLLIKGLFRFQTRGLEHLPEQGPIVLTPNHVSYLDALAVSAALGYERLRQIFWAGSQDVIFYNPLFRLAARLAQTVPIDPRRAAVSSLAFGAAVLKRGHSLIWFPEGRRAPAGELVEFKSGIGILLEHFQVPVVPVFIAGTYRALPPGKFWPRIATRITVSFGSPCQPNELARHGQGEQAEDRIARALHDQVAALAEQS